MKGSPRPAEGRTLVVIPTYDEAGTILELARAVLAQGSAIDVLVVDDDSPDGTGDLVGEAGRSQPRLLLERRPGKLGLGSAYLLGFRIALARGYRHVVTMDGDGSHDPAHLPALLDGMRTHDLMIGSRYCPGGGIANWGFHRRLLSSVANRYTRLLLRLPIRDCTSGYRCYARAVLESVDPGSIRGAGYSFLEEMVWRVHRAGFRIGEAPILFADRRHGTSKIDRSEILRAAWHVLVTALVRPAPPQRKAMRKGDD